MSVFDLIILAVLAVLTLRGIWKGMVSQVVSVASYFVCWIVATRFGGLFAPTIPVESPWNQVLAMGIVFLITLIAIRFTSVALEKLVKNWHLQKLNALLGGMLGFAKGLLICLIITFFAVMFSETSRAVVFNSKSGFHLVQLITQIGGFVPKDSYEFVHTQLATFQENVNTTDPDQPPEPLKVQSSEAMQRMVAQLKKNEGNSESEVSSLWTALSKWWGTPKDKPKTETKSETSAVPSLSMQNRTPSPSSILTYTPPPPPVVPQVNTHPTTSPSAVPKPQVVTAEEFFVQRTNTGVPSAPLPQLTALVPSVAPSASGGTATLTSLAPLTEALSIMPESSQLLQTMPTPHHVGSDLILRNSMLPPKPNAAARVFRP